MHLHTGRKWIKVGRLHSRSALLQTEHEWQKKWGYLVRYSADALDRLRSDDDSDGTPSDSNCSLTQSCLHGFEKEESTVAFNMYCMLQDQILDIEAEQDLSTDEDEIEDVIPKYEKEPQSSHTSEDVTSIPDLLLPDLNPGRSLLYRTPPFLTAGYIINPAGTAVTRRPYVALERMNKDLEAKLMADVRNVIVTTVKQSRSLSKRGTKNKAALPKTKNVDVKYVKKRARKRTDKITNSCPVNGPILRSSKLQHNAKYSNNASVKFTCKDSPVELPKKRRRKKT